MLYEPDWSVHSIVSKAGTGPILSGHNVDEADSWAYQSRDTVGLHPSGLQMVELTLLSSQDGLGRMRADVERPQQQEDS